MTLKNILKQILMLLVAAALVFLMFYNCTGHKSEEKTEVKQDNTNSVYTNDCRALYLEARRNDSIILLANDIDPVVGNSAIKAFSDFSFYCPNDSLAPVFL
jgi:hypothetical protein